jgi:hypothetical protein
MARDLRLTRAAISNVANGRRVPGREMLSRIGVYSGVCAEWLLFGKGEPSFKSDRSADGDALLPLANRLLAGPISAHRDSLSDALLPVLRRDFRETRYWYCVDAVEKSGAKPIANDFLLIESDGCWREQPRLLEHHLCVVRLTSVTEPRLCEVMEYVEEKGIAVSRPVIESTLSAVSPILLKSPAGPHRKLTLLNTKVAASEEDSKRRYTLSAANPELRNRIQRSKARSAGWGYLPLESVVGVVVLQQRRWPWK